MRARVVSMPCLELFERQPQDYRDSVLPRDPAASPDIDALLDAARQRGHAPAAIEPGHAAPWRAGDAGNHAAPRPSAWALRRLGDALHRDAGGAGWVCRGALAPHITGPVSTWPIGGGHEKIIEPAQLWNIARHLERALKTDILVTTLGDLA